MYAINSTIGKGTFSAKNIKTQIQGSEFSELCPPQQDTPYQVTV